MRTATELLEAAKSMLLSLDDDDARKLYEEIAEFLHEKRGKIWKMSEIICTKKDFHKYVGPRIRNVIQAMTKKIKKKLDYICQNCKEKKELEAAHIHGKSRKDIIESILNAHVIDVQKNLVKVDLDKFEKEITDSHNPLEEHFKFLCAKCHTEYDSKKDG